MMLFLIVVHCHLPPACHDLRMDCLKACGFCMGDLLPVCIHWSGTTVRTLPTPMRASLSLYTYFSLRLLLALASHPAIRICAPGCVNSL